MTDNQKDKAAKGTNLGKANTGVKGEPQELQDRIGDSFFLIQRTISLMSYPKTI